MEIFHGCLVFRHEYLAAVHDSDRDYDERNLKILLISEQSARRNSCFPEIPKHPLWLEALRVTMKRRWSVTRFDGIMAVLQLPL